MFNNVTMIGRLCDEVETREVGEKKVSVAKFRIAVNNPMRENETLFINVQSWGKQADNCAKFLKKGHEVLVSGSLKDDSWINKDDQKVNSVIINANTVQFLTKKSESGGGGGDSSDVPADAPVSDDIPF